jgi:uncharacterized protein (DUF983 family)
MGPDSDRSRAVPLPETYWQAAVRAGAHGKCPRCGEARLFRQWLKPVDRCPACGQDWSLQRADDFPPYVAIILTGHLMAPLLILLVRDFRLSVPALFAIIVPLAIATMLGILQPAKGAIIALQWWLGLVGFAKERPLAQETEQP